MAKTGDTKVLVIGLDGGKLDLIRELAKEGLMPNMSSLIGGGVSGDLESVFPPITAPAWASFMTGKNPGKHGVFNFFENLRDLDNRRIISYGSIKTETLISIATDAGKKIVSINMPVTYPAPSVDGCVISGMFTPDLSSNFTHPPGLYAELKDKLGEYVITVPYQRYDEKNMDVFLGDIMHCLRQRTRYGLELMRRHEWDLFMLVFSSTDYVQHAMWNYLDEDGAPGFPKPVEKHAQRLRDFYKKLDESIGLLLKEAGDNTQVFLISDHGFGPLKKRFYVNTWLSGLGLLHYSTDAGFAVRRAVEPILNSLKGAIIKLDRHDFRKKIKGKAGKFTYDTVFQHIDWSKTKAFCGSFSDQGIYINTKGSWPKGIVSPGKEYEEVRDTVISEFKKLEDPETGAAIDVELHKREDIYSGDHIEGAPDILFVIDKGACIAENLPSRTLFDEPTRKHGYGFHRKEGMLVAHGHGIEKNKSIASAGIMDIAPTILYSLGLEIPGDMDGSILSGIFEEDFKAGREPLYRESSASLKPETGEDAVYSKDDEKEIEERLKGLGYM